MYEFTNPVFDKDNSSGDQDEMDAEMDMDVFAEMLATQEKLQELMETTENQKLDFKSLNNKRFGNDSLRNSQFEGSEQSDLIKIGSLQSATNATREQIFLEIAKIDSKTSVPVEYEAATRTLIDYFAYLGTPNCSDDMDYQFLDAILSGGDINVKDAYGQTLMHEVAREWSTDLAYFLKLRGIKVDVADHWGRTPLFIAVAANHTDMVSWLLKNGADIHHHTVKGESQFPTHFAAKYDAVESFQILMDSGANPLARDKHSRTPFYLAAEIGNSRICSYFLDLELPVACYANSGVSTIDMIVENLPSDLILRALDQFMGGSGSTKNNIPLYLSCLGKRRWRLLAKGSSASNTLTHITPPDTYEIIARKADLSLISHPVIVQLQNLKFKRYAAKYIYLNIVFHLIFSVLWTVSLSYRVADIEDGRLATSDEKIAILLLTILSQILTFVFMYKLYWEWKLERRFIDDQKTRLKGECDNAEAFCHSRWPTDQSMLEKKRDTVEVTEMHFWNDGWTYIEILCLTLACVNSVITFAWYALEEKNTLIQRVRIYFSPFFLLVLWVRINRCFKSLSAFTPFIWMIGECVTALAQIGFLFCEFFVPCAVTMWVWFAHGTPGGAPAELLYTNPFNLIYELWLMSIIGDFDFDRLQGIKKYLAQIFVGFYFLVVSIITINIYIALLSDAFSRVIATSTGVTYLEEARYILNIEKQMPELKRKFEVFLNRYCAPMVVDRRDFELVKDLVNTRKVLSKSALIVADLNQLLPKLIDNEANIKKNISYIEEKIHTFQTKYSKGKTRELMKKFKSWTKFQSAPLGKMAKTTDKIMDFLTGR